MNRFPQSSAKSNQVSAAYSQPVVIQSHTPASSAWGPVSASQQRVLDAYAAAAAVRRSTGDNSAPIARIVNTDDEHVAESPHQANAAPRVASPNNSAIVSSPHSLAPVTPQSARMPPPVPNRRYINVAALASGAKVAAKSAHAESGTGSSEEVADAFLWEQMAPIMALQAAAEKAREMSHALVPQKQIIQTTEGRYSIFAAKSQHSAQTQQNRALARQHEEEEEEEEGHVRAERNMYHKNALAALQMQSSTLSSSAAAMANHTVQGGSNNVDDEALWSDAAMSIFT